MRFEQKHPALEAVPPHEHTATDAQNGQGRQTRNLAGNDVMDVGLGAAELGGDLAHGQNGRIGGDWRRIPHKDTIAMQTAEAIQYTPLRQSPEQKLVTAQPRLMTSRIAGKRSR